MKQNAVWGQLALVAGILTAFCMTALFTTCNTNVRNAPYIAVSVMFAILCAVMLGLAVWNRLKQGKGKLALPIDKAFCWWQSFLLSYVWRSLILCRAGTLKHTLRPCAKPAKIMSMIFHHLSITFSLQGMSAWGMRCSWPWGILSGRMRHRAFML